MLFVSLPDEKSPFKAFVMRYSLDVVKCSADANNAVRRAEDNTNLYFRKNFRPSGRNHL